MIQLLFIFTVIVGMATGALLFGLGFSSGSRWERNQQQEIDQLTRRRT